MAVHDPAVRQEHAGVRASQGFPRIAKLLPRSRLGLGTKLEIDALAVPLRSHSAEPVVSVPPASVDVASRFDEPSLLVAVAADVPPVVSASLDPPSVAALPVPELSLASALPES